MNLRLAFAIVLLLAPSLAWSQDFVVPSSNTSVEGDSSNVIPFASSGGNVRYQQVYLEGDIPAGPFTIYGIAFRPDALQGSFSYSIPEVDILLGTTTQGTNLNTQFDLNVGPQTLVASNAIQLASSAVGPVGGPLEFDIEIWFDQPYAYDGGNLLLDVTVGPYASSDTVLFDAVNNGSDPVSRVFSAGAAGGSASSPTGTADTQGLVTKFLLPEPADPAAAAIAAIAALVWARLPRRRALFG